MSLETMTKIGTYTVGAGGISSFSFSGIPQTYTDLIVKASARVSGSEAYATAEFRMQFNSDTTAANYKYMQQWGLGTGSVGSNTGSNFFFGNIEGGGMTANVFSSSEVYIQNYSGNSFKNAMFFSAEEASAASATIANGITKWSNTAPITSITILSNTNSFVQYSTFTLYGVKSMRTAVGNSIKATGGAIAFDGTYVTHTFNTSGSFTPTTNLLVDYLVIAGGGPGGHRGAGSSDGGGGGGAGGYRCSVTGESSGRGASAESKLNLTSSTNYIVTIGAGGSAAGGTNGSDSVFSTITSTGGGYGGSADRERNSGGAGGGTQGSNLNIAGGTGTTGQGYNGGGISAGAGSGNEAGNGGGGAGSQPTDINASSSTGGNGGNGVSSSITGSSVARAGGGAGGRRFNGTSTGTATAGGGTATNAGTANTGGGGGGQSSTTVGANGGSGIVIIRYKG